MTQPSVQADVAAPATPRERDVSVDLVRVIGLIAVVAGHIYMRPVIRTAIYTWHVPLFFFLTGFLWTRDKPLRQELWRRTQTLLIPYLCWLGIVTAIYFGRKAHHDGSWKALQAYRPSIIRGGFFLQRPYSAYWFITALFVGVIVYALLRRLPGIVRAGTALVLFALTPVLGVRWHTTRESWGIGLLCVFFIAAGEGFQRVKPKQPLVVGAVVGAVAVALVKLADVSALNLKAGDFGTRYASSIVAILTCMAMLLVARSLPIPRLVRPAITLLAELSLPIVLGHALLLVYFFPQDGLFRLFLIAFLTPVAVGLLVRWTPLAKPLLGR